MFLDGLVSTVNAKLEFLEKADSETIREAELAFTCENEKLSEQISILKQSLVDLELIRGDLQYEIPQVPKEVDVIPNLNSIDKAVNLPPPTAAPANPAAGIPAGKPSNVKPASKVVKDNGEQEVDVSRLDMRVGRIVEVSRHPDADSLYVEKVDVGENGKLRTIISGLVKHVPIEQMQNRVGIFMVNLKPAKMRGIESQGMLMCASREGFPVEPLIIEGSDVQLGDRVFVEGYPGEPDAQMNPKKKIFEQVKPELRVNEQRLATYRGTPWKLQGNPNANIKAPTLTDAQIS